MFLKLFLLLAIVAAAVSVGHNSLDIDYDHHWYHFKKVHNKHYNSREENYRRSVFADNLNKIIKHNIEADLGLHSFTLGVNQYADMSNEEFALFFNGFKKSQKSRSSKVVHSQSSSKLPDSVDWRKKGLVTGVKDQQHCRSCWAFSAVAAIEGQHAKVTGKLVSLSEQQLVDCSIPFDNHGCNGGLMDNAFSYVIANGGIDTEESYSYEAIQRKCRYSNAKIGAKISNYVDVEPHNENALKDAAARVGPISVAIQANLSTFQFYSHGVYDDPNCLKDLDHGVTVVGYGTDDSIGKEYWLVKNSWGQKWGDHGYIRIARNSGNRCGIASMASYPVV